MRLPSTLGRLNDRLRTSASGYMVVLAVAIGLLGGYGAVGFRHLIRLLQELFWSTDAPGTAWIESLPWYWVVGAPALGGLLVGALVRGFAAEAKGHGVPEVMEAVALRNGRIRPRVVLVKSLASGISIASGGSVGREGPIVQIGSAIGSTVGQLLNVGPRRMRTLVGCGAAAGIAGTFNAPVAGALFAVEVILGDFSVPQFSPIVLASVAATVVSHHYLGDLPAFEVPQYILVHPVELLAYTALGLLAAVTAVGFIRMLYRSEDLFDAVRAPLPAKAAVGGAAVGALALLMPGVLGVGYESINLALVGSPTLTMLLLLLVAKLVAVCITLGSGGSGGVFAPSLFLGAMLGGAVGLCVQTLMPETTGHVGAYALVGMGAVVAATTQAPITAILVVFELTNDYRIMLPLMTACIIATMLAARLGKESIYTLKLARRGVNIRAGQDVNLLRNIPLQEVLRPTAHVIDPSESLTGIIRRITEEDAAGFYVVGADGVLLGVISMRELRPAMHDAKSLGSLVVARDLVEADFPSLKPDETLDTVLTRLDQVYRDELPVVRDGRLAGVVRTEDVIARYRRELAKRQVAEGD